MEASKGKGSEFRKDDKFRARAKTDKCRELGLCHWNEVRLKIGVSTWSGWEEMWFVQLTDKSDKISMCHLIGSDADVCYLPGCWADWMEIFLTVSAVDGFSLGIRELYFSYLFL